MAAMAFPSSAIGLTSRSEAEEFIIRNKNKKEERNEEEGK